MRAVGPAWSPVGACDLSGAGGAAVATISSLLADHVSLRVRFLNDHAGGTIPSPALFGKIGRSYAEDVNAFAKAHEIPVVRFAKGVVKEDVARPYMQKAEREGRSGVVMLGVAQEKAFAWRGWRDGGNDAHPHFKFD